MKIVVRGFTISNMELNGLSHANPVANRGHGIVGRSVVHHYCALRTGLRSGEGLKTGNRVGAGFGCDAALGAASLGNRVSEVRPRHGAHLPEQIVTIGSGGTG